MTNSSRLLRWAILGGSLAAAGLVLAAPDLPVWGARQLPHEDARTLPLPGSPSSKDRPSSKDKHQVEQTVTWEGAQLDAVVVWLDGASLPETGELVLTAAGKEVRESRLNVADIPPSGIAFFPLSSPLPVSAGERGSFSLYLQAPASARAQLRYQIAAEKYAGGELVYHPNLNKVGDLAFQLRYRRPALGAIQLPAAALLALAGGVFFFFSRRYPLVPLAGAGRERLGPLDGWVAAGLLAAISIFYGSLVLKPGVWIGPSDFTKEISYVTASAAALRAGSWPAWSHLVCGGLPLLGNPEGTTLSLSTPLALVLPAEQAHWLLVALEAGLAAAGAYVLARAMGAQRAGSLLAALVYSLSAFYAYKIVEGIVMVGGALAFTPWVLVGLVRGLQSRRLAWPLFSGLGLTLIFWRGDVHIIIGVLAVVVLWVLLASKPWRRRQRRTQPAVWLALALAIFFLGSSVKALSYFEQPQLIGAGVDPHSTIVTQHGLWRDIFLGAPPRETKIATRYGLPEHFGYAGAYIGGLPLLLALLGLAIPHRWRTALLAALVLLLAVIDGTLFDLVLRHAPPLDALLRMPVRLLSVAVLLLSVAAGFGLSALLAALGDRRTARAALSALFIGAAAADLIFVSGGLLRDNLAWRADRPSPPPAPQLVPHANSSPAGALDTQRHASVLLAGGQLLPHVCGDQNNPPEFLASIDSPTPVSDYPVRLTPNRAWAGPVDGPADVIVRERFVSSWAVSPGSVLPADAGALHVLVPAGGEHIVQLRYLSPMMRAQQLLLFIMLLLGGWLAGYGVFQRVRLPDAGAGQQSADSQYR